jgi:hypothetical protein
VLLVQIKVLCDALSKRVKALKRYESKLIYNMALELMEIKSEPKQLNNNCV